MGESLQTSANPGIDSDPLPCPHCGYDLRANPAEKCSECGQPFDRSILGITSFPWPHRRALGRIGAYCKTVWLITINSRRLRYEPLKNQNRADARSFQRVTTFIAALALGTSMAAVLGAEPALFAQPIPQPRPSNWTDDLILPWLAGANLLPVLPGALLLLAIHLTSIQHALFRLKSAPTHIQDRAFAIACYATAPLAWLFPLAIFSAASISMVVSGALEGMLFILIGPLLALLLFPFTILRIVQWNLRVRNLSFEYALLIGPRLIGLWLFALILDLGILPWCIGSLYLAIDSFR